MKIENRDAVLACFVCLSLVLLNLSFVVAEESEAGVLHVFYGQGCPHCAKAMDFLNDVEAEYGLVVEKHEVYFDVDERGLFENLSLAFDMEIEGVPTFFVGEGVFVGFSDSIGDEIEGEIESCLDDGCGDPVDMIGEKGKEVGSLTVSAVVFAAIVDAINPCAFAVLIILMSTVLVSDNRRRALFCGLAFSLSIFISYFLMGIGLYSAIQVSGLTHSFFWVVAVLAIFIGLFNLKDYLWYGKWFTMEVPHSWRPRMKGLIRGVTSVPGAFFIGFVISLFLLPCTSGPYIVILGLLAKAVSRGYALGLLVLYNLIFVMPMVLISFGIYFGWTTTERAEKIRGGKLEILHLIAGIIILCLGVGMIVAILLGAI